MNIRVILFAAARELAGCNELIIEVAQQANVGEVCRAVTEACPELRPILPHCLWAVNARYASAEQEVTEDSEVAIIPPVSGG
jgi:molybdopterin converting factor subunit 1